MQSVHSATLSCVNSESRAAVMVGCDGAAAAAPAENPLGLVGFHRDDGRPV